MTAGVLSECHSRFNRESSFLVIIFTIFQRASKELIMDSRVRGNDSGWDFGMTMCEVLE